MRKHARPREDNRACWPPRALEKARSGNVGSGNHSKANSHHFPGTPCLVDARSKKIQNEKIAPLPRFEQIQWLVNRNRIANCGPFTDLQLREYCEANSAEPEDPDKWFVLAHEILSPESFFVIWTTTRQIRLRRNLSRPRWPGIPPGRSLGRRSWFDYVGCKAALRRRSSYHVRSPRHPSCRHSQEGAAERRSGEGQVRRSAPPTSTKQHGVSAP